MADDRSLTSRRSVIAGLAGSTLSLAGVWAALGLGGTGHGGHTHGALGGSPAAFERRTRAFREAFETGTGTVTVHPPVGQRWRASGSVPGCDSDGQSDDCRPPILVYLLARQWAYSPSTLRLSAGTPYRFRMMSTDVTHGVAINRGHRAVMHRLPPGQLVEDTLVFETPGRYPIYCGYYCGPGHRRMTATLVVEERDDA